MNQIKDLEINQWAEIDCDHVDFDALEEKLESELEEQLADLEALKEDYNKIGDPDTIGNTVMTVVWEQFINQIGVVAGEEFIRENRGLTLDLRDSAHIQTIENFAEGKIATHNTSIDYQKRYNDWQFNFQRNEDGSIRTKYDRIDDEEVKILRTYKNGNNDYNYNYKARAYIDKGRPKGSASMHKDHTISAAEIIRDPQANAHLTREQHAEFANSEINLIDLDSSANESKQDHKMENWLNSERFGLKPAERFNIDEEELRARDKAARKEYDKVKAEGERVSIESGKASQKDEAFKIGKHALRSVIMGMLASLIKDIIKKMVAWFRSGERKFSTFIESVKDAIKSFITNLKEHLLTAGNTLLTTVATAIFGPIIGALKKAWIFLKQGYKSLKDAIAFLKDPANREMPFSIKLMNVGKIVIAGLTAGGAILLGELIEKALMSIPVFAIQIPLMGSLAGLLGIFFGAMISGLIGALALNFIDRKIAARQKELNLSQQYDQRNGIIMTQERLLAVSAIQIHEKKASTANDIGYRHKEAAEAARDICTAIDSNSMNSDDLHFQNNQSLDNINDLLNDI